MKLDYKSKKWDKEVSHAIKMKKSFKKMNIDPEKKNLEVFFTKFQNSNKDYLWLYNILSHQYDLTACNHYILDVNADDIVQYEYLSGLSMLIAKYLLDSGIEWEDIDYWRRNIECDIDGALYKMIAAEQTDNFYFQKEKEHIITALFYGDHERVQELIETMPDPDESQTVYYISAIYQKEIYKAILDHDEKAFNVGLAKRIRKYRKNMQGYSTIIDISSVALIKIAEKEGIRCMIDVIEIPKQFFDERCVIDREAVRLPYYDELMEDL